MQIQTKIGVDLNRPGIQAVPAMQHDGQTRAVEISLRCDGEAWQPPEGVTAAIGYEKPDRTRGLYDKLSDGSAVRISKYEYLTPDKKSMAELGGVMPDIASYQIEDSDMDVQLEAAKDAVH